MTLLSRLRWLIVPILGVAFLSVDSSTAEARRRGLILITTGHTIKNIGPIPAESAQMVRESVGNKNYEVGLQHNRFGIFWLDLWTWEPEYVLYDPDNEEDGGIIEPSFAAEILQVEESDLPKPFFYSVPPGLVALIVLGGLWAFVALKDSKEESAVNDKIDRLKGDVRYQHALKPLLAYYQQPAPEGQTPEQEAAANEAAFNKAVQQVVDQGVSREEAEQNLALLVQAAANEQNQFAS
ncbi:MAG: hypothetical protein RH917_12570 [Lacipirellulaceae bacterium]